MAPNPGGHTQRAPAKTPVRALRLDTF